MTSASADGLLPGAKPRLGQSGPALSNPGLNTPGLSDQAQAERILPVESAFGFSSYSTENGVELFWQVQPGYYLYRDKISVLFDGQTVLPELPIGTWRDDEIFGEVLVLEGLVETLVPLGEAKAVSVEVRYQGCAAKGYCYPPQKITLNSAKK